MVSGTDATPPLFPQDKPASAQCPLPHRVAEIYPLSRPGTPQLNLGKSNPISMRVDYPITLYLSKLTWDVRIA